MTASKNNLRIDPINPVGMGMMPVVAQFIVQKKRDDDAQGNTYRKPKDIYQRDCLCFPKAPYCGFKDVFEHGRIVVVVVISVIVVVVVIDLSLLSGCQVVFGA
jgi:hypothetical protein